MSTSYEFETVDLIVKSNSGTREVDAFALAVIKAERQLRKLLTHLVFLCLMLILVSIFGCGDGRKNAAASDGRWVQVGETKDVVFYIDPTSIRKDGHLRKAWELVDLKRRAKRGEMSIRILFEYDCKMRKVRALSGVSFSKPMAEGEILSSFSTYDWQDVLPDTDDVVTFKFVCSK